MRFIIREFYYSNNTIQNKNSNDSHPSMCNMNAYDNVHVVLVPKRAPYIPLPGPHSPCFTVSITYQKQ